MKISSKISRENLDLYDFGTQLQWHFDRGTRNGIITFKPWGRKEFAGKLGVSETSVHNWLECNIKPKYSIVDVYKHLFADEASALDMKEALAAAYNLIGNDKYNPNLAEPKYGAYERRKYKFYEGDYLFYRPAFDSARYICVFLMTIAWDEYEGALIISGSSENNVMWGAVIAIADGYPFIQMSTISSNGTNSLIIANKMDENNMMFGTILTLGNGKRSTYHPCVAPVVFEKNVVGLYKKNCIIGPSDADYQRIKDILSMVRRQKLINVLL